MSVDQQTRPRESIAEIVMLLTADIERLAAELLPMGSRHKAEWVEASTRNGGLGDSLSVRLTGSRAGIWAHFAAGQSGDALDLIAYLKTGGDKADALRYAREFLGLSSGGAGRAAGASPEALAAARQAKEERERRSARERERRTAHAQALWLSAAKLGRDDAVARYLAGRGIGPLQLGRAPGCLRAGQSVRHRDGTDWPAMLAAIISLDGRHVATHRTWLHDDGCPVTKAPVEPAKMVLGDYAGAHIPLWKGRHRQTLRDLPAGVLVYISEGIEDGLSVTRLMPDARVVAAVSVANMGSIDLPEQVRDVVLVVQNDPPTLPDGRPHPARLALRRAIAAHQAAGRRVRLARPDPRYKDFNDWVCDIAISELESNA